MAELFGLSDKELIFFKAQAIASGDWTIFKMDKNAAEAYLVKYCEYLNFDEVNAESIIEAIYTVCQNRLFKQDNLTNELLLILPTFNLFGQINLTELLTAFENDGKEAFEESFRTIFSDGWERRRKEYNEITKKIFTLRYATFQEYGTVESANKLINQIGIEKCARLSPDEFLQRLEIRISRRGLTNYEKYGIVICSAVNGDWHRINADRNEVMNLIQEFCEVVDLSEGIEQAANSIFTPTQNGLMNYRKDDFYVIQEEPPFSDFGRENLIRFLDAWATGGKESLEQVFNQVFSDGWENRKPKQEIIRILSGDGETQETAIKFSTNDMQKRIRTEFCYVYYRFGEDWNHMHSTVLGNDGKAYSCWVLDFADGTSKTIYFDTNKEF